MKRHLVFICEICGCVLDEHHCKAQCPNCGRMLDCSDLPVIQANALVNDGAPPDTTPAEDAAAADEPVAPPPTTLTVRPAQELKSAARPSAKNDGKAGQDSLP